MRPAMSESTYQHVKCQAIVLTITKPQLQGDPISDQLRADLLGALERSGARHVVLDFQRVAYVSSVAFRPLLSLHPKLKERSGRLVRCGITVRVPHVFPLTPLFAP